MPGVVTMTSEKIKTIVVSPITPLINLSFSSLVTWALFLVVMILIGDGDL